MSKLTTWSGSGYQEYNEKNEWYTLSKYIESARKVMGGMIDTDPASCYEANLTIKASTFYTQRDDGLTKQWYGNVWINPPFVGGLSAWMEYLLNQYKIGNVQQAVALYPAASGVLSTKWFHALLKYPMCIPFRRMTFSPRGERKKQHPPFSCLLSYLGDGDYRFISEFKKYGDIITKVRDEA